MSEPPKKLISLWLSNIGIIFNRINDPFFKEHLNENEYDNPKHSKCPPKIIQENRVKPNRPFNNRLKVNGQDVKITYRPNKVKDGADQPDENKDHISDMLKNIDIKFNWDLIKEDIINKLNLNDKNYVTSYGKFKKGEQEKYLLKLNKSQFLNIFHDIFKEFKENVISCLNNYYEYLEQIEYEYNTQKTLIKLIEENNNENIDNDMLLTELKNELQEKKIDFTNDANSWFKRNSKVDKDVLLGKLKDGENSLKNEKNKAIQDKKYLLEQIVTWYIRLDGYLMGNFSKELQNINDKDIDTIINNYLSINYYNIGLFDILHQNQTDKYKYCQNFLCQCQAEYGVKGSEYPKYCKQHSRQDDVIIKYDNISSYSLNEIVIMSMQICDSKLYNNDEIDNEKYKGSNFKPTSYRMYKSLYDKKHIDNIIIPSLIKDSAHDFIHQSVLSNSIDTDAMCLGLNLYSLKDSLKLTTNVNKMDTINIDKRNNDIDLTEFSDIKDNDSVYKKVYENIHKNTTSVKTHGEYVAHTGEEFLYENSYNRFFMNVKQTSPRNTREELSPCWGSPRIHEITLLPTAKSVQDRIGNQMPGTKDESFHKLLTFMEPYWDSGDIKGYIHQWFYKRSLNFTNNILDRNQNRFTFPGFVFDMYLSLKKDMEQGLKGMAAQPDLYSNDMINHFFFNKAKLIFFRPMFF